MGIASEPRSNTWLRVMSFARTRPRPLILAQFGRGGMSEPPTWPNGWDKAGWARFSVIAEGQLAAGRAVFSAGITEDDSNLMRLHWPGGARFLRLPAGGGLGQIEEERTGGVPPGDEALIEQMWGVARRSLESGIRLLDVSRG